ncbi:MAG: hypothetical protein R3F65_15180 [bacterium]|nr:hypothetical protein [Myxococcales bacterium]
MAPAFDQDAMRAFGKLIGRMIGKEPLTRDETRDAYRQIYGNQQPELQQGAFIAAHKAKGETVDELVGLVEAHTEEWIRCFTHEVRAPRPHVGIVGVGMDSMKTFNISSTSAVVAAACGIYVHKVGAPGMTSITGCADAFQLWGVDGQGPLDKQVQSVAACRLGFTTPVTPHLKHMGIARVLSQLRIPTSMHLAGPLDRHSGERHKIVGVPEPRYVDMIGQTLARLGFYKRALVPCGGVDALPGRYLDEFSNLGATEVAELHEDGTVERYTLRPADVGLEVADYRDVQSADTREANARLGARIIAGKGNRAQTDLVAFNAAAALRVLGEADWKDGIARAREAMATGAALAQLRALIEHQNRDPADGLARLDALLAG